MTGPGFHQRAVGNRKKSRIPLSKLRASDAVKTVLNQPRRLEELLRMLEDKDRTVRGRAAVAIAQISESRPARLLRVIPRLREMLTDESAYVRWHLLHAFGKLGARYPIRMRHVLPDLIARLEDDNRVCRIIALLAIARIATQRPNVVRECFLSLKRDIPPRIAAIIRSH